MRNKIYTLVLLAALSAFSLSGCDSPHEQWHLSPDHFKTGYVPWGTDEFELFGLTKQELDKKFKSEMHFNGENSSAVFEDRRSGHFHLTFDNDGKISAVQRIFIDGAGCRIKGPLLSSKRAALEFSVDGLSNLGNLSKGEQTKLSTAKALLKELSN